MSVPSEGDIRSTYYGKRVLVPGALRDGKWVKGHFKIEQASCWPENEPGSKPTYRGNYRLGLINYLKATQPNQYQRAAVGGKGKVAWDSQALQDAANRLLDIAARTNPQLVIKPLIINGVDLHSPAMRQKAQQARKQKAAERKEKEQKKFVIPHQQKMMNQRIARTVSKLSENERVHNLGPSQMVQHTQANATGRCSILISTKTSDRYGQSCGNLIFTNLDYCGIHDPQLRARVKASKDANADIAMLKIANRAQLVQKNNGNPYYSGVQKHERSMCIATTQNGQPCGNRAINTGTGQLCGVHNKSMTYGNAVGIDTSASAASTKPVQLRRGKAPTAKKPSGSKRLATPMPDKCHVTMTNGGPRHGMTCNKKLDEGGQYCRDHSGKAGASLTAWRAAEGKQEVPGQKPRLTPKSIYTNPNQRNYVETASGSYDRNRVEPQVGSVAPYLPSINDNSNP